MMEERDHPTEKTKQAKMAFAAKGELPVEK